MHNTVSLDGAFIGFDFSPELLGLHYQIASNFGDTIRLFGSNTAVVSMEMFGGFTPETPEDFQRPCKPENLSYWVVPDSEAVLKHKLHFFRRSEYCRDVAVLIAEETPHDYARYLQDRNYDYFIAGRHRVDLARALSLITDHYKLRTVLVDSGRSLTNAMLNQGLVDEISLLVSPTIVGKNAQTLFTDLERPVSLSLKLTQSFPGGYAYFLYEVRHQ
jgi:2,5-diamino-6-(ribosylamino)-4(3H)-pyrimidinone 5'-phosphate reductase